MPHIPTGHFLRPDIGQIGSQAESVPLEGTCNLVYDLTEMIASNETIEQVGESLGKAAHARKVILFGSHASGHAHADSDVDFLVIAESQLPRHKRSRDLYAMFHPYPFPMDILVYTPEEVDRQLRDPDSFVSSVLAEGKEVYVG